MFRDPTDDPFGWVLRLFVQLEKQALRQVWEHAELAGVSGQHLEELRRLSPAAFERWVGARFQERGYQVQLTGTHGTGGDHGIDLVVSKSDERAVVQCKNSQSVGEPVLHALLGVMHHAKADKAYLVTTGRLTGPAWQWVRGKPIEVWDARVIVQLTPRARVVEVPPKRATSAPPQLTDRAVRKETTCPKCGARLVERRNRQTGEPFLGCAGFPNCRYTRPIRG